MRTVTIGSVAQARILIVEDEPLITMMLEDMLKRFGFVCAGRATRVETGLEMARSIEVDAAVLNLMLHGEPAYAICQVLADRGIPFAFASGVAKESIPELWRDRLYINKPFDVDEVAKVLRKLINHPEKALSDMVEQMPATEQKDSSDQDSAPTLGATT